MTGPTYNNDRPFIPWIPASEQLPEAGRLVLIFWKNEYDRPRISMGYYTTKHTYEASDDWTEDECDVANDGIFYIPEGWYEAPWEVENCARITNVTHWSPLPLPPPP